MGRSFLLPPWPDIIGEGNMWCCIWNSLQVNDAFITIIRLGIAVLLGGMLGIERGRKRRPAGFRTYMIVCMASALVMMTGTFLIEEYNMGDPARLGAQVISGIGFLGAGTIIVTPRQVKGLTTAAGLWASACMGLAVGAGFYTGAVAAGFFVLVIMSGFTRMDDRIRRSSRQLNFFAEFQSMEMLGEFLAELRAKGIKLYDIEISRKNDDMNDLVGVNLFVGLAKPENHVEIIHQFSQYRGVKYIEELDMV